MRIGVLKETAAGEHRVALVPDVVRKLHAAGHEVIVEAGAGESAGFHDQLFVAAGAVIGDPCAAELVVAVRAPDPERLRAEQVLIGFLAPLTDVDGIQALAARGVTAFAMESVPRISRAQSMDALSSQATVSGYKAVLIAAGEIDRFFPMLMTAAGTIPPAQVLVLGAGVAGLQAIATARRLGAVVTAFDVRSAVAEQVRSLGAKFLEVEGVADAEERALQRAAVDAQVTRSDVVITTALIPGRPAPKLVSTAAVEAMKAGSIVVDLAAEAGGNCELARPGETYTTANGVIIAAPLNVPSSMAEHASQLYARNVFALLELMSGSDGAPSLDFDDEIIRGACVTRAPDVAHAGVKQADPVGS
jgi:H+-translocating NAD(P) transhydrogenase subunit alpha